MLNVLQVNKNYIHWCHFNAFVVNFATYFFFITNFELIFTS